MQFTETLGAAVWTDLPGDVSATGNTATKTDNMGTGASRFYRILVVP